LTKARGWAAPGPGFMACVDFNGLSTEIDCRLKAGYPKEML
jgi:hypothetical protein